MIEYDFKTYTSSGYYFEEHLYMGKLHCIDGPARKKYEKNSRKQNVLVEEEYWINGLAHREDGPALIRYDKKGNIVGTSYALNGIRAHNKKLLHVSILNQFLINHDLRIIMNYKVALILDNPPCTIINTFSEDIVHECNYDDLEKDIPVLLTD